MRIGPASPARPADSPPAVPRTAAGGKAFSSVLVEGTAAAPAPPTVAAGKPAAVPAHPVVPGPPAGPVRAVFARALGAEKQVDALLEAAARGKTFTPAQLLAMQATVARYAQTVEVVSRVADRLVGAIKQTMGTQV
ncbi:MAG TPA: hypothetical protein VGP64_03615 [Polyangia bacterium]|jgi:hypothetical protein